MAKKKKQSKKDLTAGGPGSPAGPTPPAAPPSPPEPSPTLTPEEKAKARFWRRLATISLGTLLVAGSAALLVLAILVWPEDVAANPGLAPHRAYGWTNAFGHSGERTILLLVIVMAALGSYIHAATSFVDFVGNRRFETTWFWWYLLRTSIGVALAVVTYIVLRGGFITSTIGGPAAGAPAGGVAGPGATDAVGINPFGSAAIGALSGLFSKQATDKLREIFDTIFRVEPDKGDAQRGAKLTSLALTRLEHGDIAAGQSARITLHGRGFTDVAVVEIGEASIEPKFVDPTRLEIVVPESELATGEYDVRVRIGDEVTEAKKIVVA